MQVRYSHFSVKKQIDDQVAYLVDTISWKNSPRFCHNTHISGPLSPTNSCSPTHTPTCTHTHAYTYLYTLRHAKSSSKTAKFISESSSQTMHFTGCVNFSSEDQKPHSCLLMHMLWSINSPPILILLCA